MSMFECVSLHVSDTSDSECSIAADVTYTINVRPTVNSTDDNDVTPAQPTQIHIVAATQTEPNVIQGDMGTQTQSAAIHSDAVTQTEPTARHNHIGTQTDNTDGPTTTDVRDAANDHTETQTASWDMSDVDSNNNIRCSVSQDNGEGDLTIDTQNIQTVPIVIEPRYTGT